MLIGIHGKIGHGKDTVAKIIKELDADVEIKKFAQAVKNLCAELIGCDVLDFEDAEFKKSILPKEWSYYTIEEDDTSSKHVICEDVIEQAKQRGKMIKHHRMTVRDLLQLVGTEGGRLGVHPNIWVNSTLKDYTYSDKWVISDLRFPNEARRIKDLGGFLVKVVRDEVPVVENEHASEKALDKFDNWDYIVYNNYDLESLYDTIEALYESIKKTK